ncbi:hypothetical protein GHT06_020851 [Daphnia sinensis]|uniref:Cuticle protein n=1 Tax=Daphnia sinensis TaxID=1820382 RepID=A0AAD5KIC0_9CRUS|nr:hypothetical protein GHT06_020851 [Daphnia sinensis]
MKVVVLAVFFCVASAQSVYYPEPTYETEHRAQPYSFSWEVNDAPSYNSFAHSESSDGKVVSGSYRVVLPDGRTQIVTYKDDSYGYVADVKYEGEAKYPESRPSYSALAYKAPTPAYPAPIAQTYQAPTTPAYEALAPIYRAPAPGYVATTPSYKSPTPVYKAPTPVYKAPVVPSYKPVLSKPYEAQPSPSYKIPEYIVPSYRPPTTVAQVYTTSTTPSPPVYSSPAPIPLLYRTAAKQRTY